MTKRTRLPQSRHHILIYDEDWQLLSDHFGPESKSKIGPGAAIREVMHQKCQRLRQMIEDRTQELGDRAVAEGLAQDSEEQQL